MKARILKVSLTAIAALSAANFHVNAVPTVYSLNAGNSDLSPAYPSPYGSVSVDLTDSTHATVTFTGGSAGGFTYLFGAHGMADVNVNATSFSVSLSTPGTASNGGANNISMFGNFNLTIDNTDGNSDAVNSVIFTLTDISGTWANSSSVLAANSDGYSVAAHIFVRDATGANPKTGFAGDGGPGRRVPDGGSTVALLGTGLLGLGWLHRMKAGKN